MAPELEEGRSRAGVGEEGGEGRSESKKRGAARARVALSSACSHGWTVSLDAATAYRWRLVIAGPHAGAPSLLPF